MSKIQNKKFCFSRSKRTGSLYLAVYFMFLLILLAGCVKNTTEFNRENYKPARESFVTQKEFYKIVSVQSQKPDFKGTVLGGTVPHHLLAGRLIKDFMEALAEQEPELIILVGPNHYNLGGKIITGLYDWQTPDGLVRTEEQVVKVLLEEKIAVRDEKVLAKEHSIGNLIPFIKHFSPDTRVVPLILHHDVSLAEVEKMLDLLEPFLDGKKGILLASVDFSHYLNRTQAQEKDRFTLEVMRNFDYSTLFHLGNDHLDSPASLATVFRYAERKGLREFQVLENTNSGIILKNDLQETTSYFTLAFTVTNAKKTQ